MFDFATFTLIILSIVIAMGRVTGFFLLLSPMSDSMIPGLCRRAIIVSFSVIVAPMVFKQLTPGMSPYYLVFMALKEVLIGAMLGLFDNFPFYLAECIGNILDNQRGSTMSEVYSPLSGAQVSTTGILFTQTVTVLFFASGVFLIALGALYKSFSIWPLFVNSLMPNSNAPAVILGMGDSLMKQTLVLSSPILIVMFLATVGLGLVNRTAPQLNVFFLSMPIKSALGIFMLIIYLQYLLRLMIYDSDDAILVPVQKFFQ